MRVDLDTCTGLRGTAILLLICLSILLGYLPNLNAEQTTGVTVLIHGFDPFGDLPFNPIDYWGEAHIRSILQAYEGGIVYVYQPDSGRFEQEDEGFQDLYDPNGEIVLVFDWRAASNNAESGQAEAAADAFFAGLVSEHYVDCENPGNSKQFHFIGHSRGASVTSEVVQRMGVYNIQVDYVTYLDAHDFDEYYVPLDEYFHDPAVQVWTNVLYADNFWQTATNDLVPSGRPLAHLRKGYLYNHDLTPLPGFEDNDGVLDHAHGKVVDWYFGTVAPGTQPWDWYGEDGSGGLGNDTGFSRWLSRRGYDYDNPTGEGKYQEGDCQPANPITLQYLQSYPVDEDFHDPPYPNDTDIHDDNDASTYFMNGDFDLPHLGGTILGPIAGWSYHGGGGYGHIDYGTNGGYLELDELNNLRRHNRMYIPYHATDLIFELKITWPSIDGDYLRVYFDDGQQHQWGEPVLLDALGYDVQVLPIPQANRNQVGTITFEIVGNGITIVDSQVQIDNISFLSTFDTPASIAVQPSWYSVPSASGNSIFTVSNTTSRPMHWSAEVTQGDSWLGITSGSSGTNSGAIQVHYTENTATTPRVGSVQIVSPQANNNPQEVTVTQEGVSTSPILNTPSISPNWGTPYTDFSFYVRYTHPGDDPPTYVKVFIDGNSSPMSSSDTVYDDGAIFSYSQSGFSVGSHSYYFEASDGTTTVRNPEQGSYQFTVSEPSPSSMDLSINPSTLEVDGASTTQVKATVRDELLNPISGEEVNFSPNGFPGAFSPTTEYTDGNGEAVTTFRPASSGTATITATIPSGLTASKTLNATSASVNVSVTFFSNGNNNYEAVAYIGYLQTQQPARFDDITWDIYPTSVASWTGSPDSATNDGGLAHADFVTFQTAPTTVLVTVTHLETGASGTAQLVAGAAGARQASPWKVLGVGDKSDIAWSPNGDILGARAHSTKVLKTWDAGTWEPLLSITDDGGTDDSLCFSPDGSYIVTDDIYSGDDIFILRATDGSIIRSWDSVSANRSMEWQGNIILAVHNDNTVKTWSSSGAFQEEFGHIDKIEEARFNPDNPSEFAAVDRDGYVKVWNVGGWQVKSILDAIAIAPLHAVAWSYDGSLLAVGGSEKTVNVYNTSTWAKTSIPNASSIHSLDFSHDDTKLAIGTTDGLRVWNFSRGTIELEGNAGTGYSVRWNHDSSLIAVGSGTVEVYVPDDSEGPLITIQSQIQNSSTAESTIIVQGTITDQYDVPSSRINVNNAGASPFQIAGDGTFSEQVNLDLGANSIVIEATDGNDNTSALAVTVTRLPDQTPPEISNTLISPSTGEEGTLFTITASVSDPSGIDPQSVAASIQHPDESPLATLSMYDDGTHGDTQSGDGIYTCEWNSTGTGEKVCYLDITASDTQSNVREVENVKTISVYDGPAVTNAIHQPTEPTDTENITVTADITDSAGVTSAVLHYLHSSSSTWQSISMHNSSADTWEGMITPQPAGQITYRITATDAFTHPGTSPDNVCIVRDISPPLFMNWVQSPSDLTNATLGAVRVHVTVIDIGGSGLDGMTPELDYRLGAGAYDGYESMTLNTGDTWFFDIPEPVDGWGNYTGQTLYYRARCSDVAGNSRTSAEQAEFVDDAFPQVTISLLTPSYQVVIQGGSTYDITWNTTGTDIDNIHLLYSTDGMSYHDINDSLPNSGTYDWNPVPFVDSNTARLKAIARNVNGIVLAQDVSDRFTIDSSPPVFNNWTSDPTALSAAHTGEFVITVEISDALSSLSTTPTCDYRLGSDSYDGFEPMTLVSGDTWSFSIPEPASEWSAHIGETLRYKVYASDIAQNAGESAEQSTDVYSELPDLQITPNPLGFLGMKPDLVASEFFTISNNGAGTLSGTVTENCPWLSLSPNTWTGNSQDITVTVDTAGMPHGVYTYDITITADPPVLNSPQMLTVQVNVIEPKWSYLTGGDVISSPAIATDGTVYVGSLDGYLYAIRNGTEYWRYPTGGEIVSSPAIDSDGHVYVGSSDHHVYAFYPDGNLKWRHPTGGLVHSSPAIGSDGTIYIGSDDSNLYVLNPDSGEEYWKYSTGGGIALPPAIGEDGTIYCCSNDNHVYSFSPDKVFTSTTLRWSRTFEYALESGPVVGPNNTIYIGCGDGFLYAIDGADGTEVTKYDMGDRILSSPAFASDGTLYIGSTDGHLYAFDTTNGTELWNYRPGGPVVASPAVGKDGVIYIGSRGDYFHAINPDGTTKWFYHLQGDVRSSAAIAADGTVYVGSDSDHLYALKSDSLGLAISAWPKYRHDNQNTGHFVNPMTSVTGLTIEKQGGNLLLSWEQSQNAISYSVYRGSRINFTPDKAGGSNRVAVQITDQDTDTPGIQWTDTAVPQDASSFYVVTAVSASGQESDGVASWGAFILQAHITPDMDYNWVGYCLDAGLSHAEQLGSAIPNCLTVSQFNTATQGYVTHPMGTPINNFPLQVGQAYQITVSADTSWSLVGRAPTSLSFSLLTTPDTDYNWITLPLDSTLATAEELGQAIPNCLTVSWFDALTQGFVTHPVGTPINDFALEPGMAYQVTVSSDTTWP